MPIVDTWDPTLPPDSENPTLGANRIREFKRAIDERLENMGASMPTGTNAASGRLTCGVQGTTGVLDLGFEADGDLALQLRDNTAVGTPSRFVIGTGVGGARDYTLATEAIECANLNVAANVLLTGIAVKSFANSPYTVLTESIIVYNILGGSSIVNLPSVATAPIGRVLFVTCYNSAGSGNTLTVTANGADTIRHYASFTGGFAVGSSITMEVKGEATGGNAGQCFVMLVATETGIWHAFFFDDYV